MSETSESTLAEVPAPNVKSWRSNFPVIFTMRGSPEWRAWLNDLARSRHMNTSGLIDFAVIEFAERIGFREPPERQPKVR